MVGSSLVRLFKKKNYTNLITRTKKQLDLLDQKKTFNFLKSQRPDVVIIAAAKVGGIKANNIYRGSFLYENLQIQTNLIHGSFLAGVNQLIFLGSSCIYPRNCKQPIKEEYLLSSSLEYTNEPYAIAKIAGVKMIENYNLQYKKNYIALMPCNLYGPNDNYNLNSSHFLPALIHKIYKAKIKKSKEVIVWGDGKPKRELMYVDDVAKACLYFLKNKSASPIINIGSGEEYSIKNFVKKISNVIGYKGKIIYDTNMPNGTPRKILDCSKANKYGWKSTILFEEGLKLTYSDFRSLNF